MRSAHVNARKKHRPITHGLVLIAIFSAVAYASVNGGPFHRKSQVFAAPVKGLTLPAVSASIAPPQSSDVLRGAPMNKTIGSARPVPASAQNAKEALNAIAATPTSTAPAVQEDAVVRAASIAPTPDLPPYQVYKVEAGDTVSSIATRFGIDPQYVIANNVEIQDSDFLKLGQSIIVPAGNGILHEVKLGDSLSTIADQYAVSVDAITAFSANHIQQADDIKETQLVFVPGGRPLPTAPAADSPALATGGPGAPAAAGTTPTPAATSDAAADAPATTDAGGSARSGSGAAASTGPASSSGLIWPVRGPISSPYGPGHPLGIDIDGYNAVGAGIAAATSGTVTFAGGNACCSYGLYVVLVSPDGIETLYGHLSSISVSQGQTVSQGETLGIIGNTGYSTGTHLHLEVIDNGVRQNPMNYLP